MAFQHKENAKFLFSSESIGPYWNDFYAGAKTCLEHHFVQRLEVSDRVIRKHAPTSGRILDLGCGAGVLSERLLESGYAVDAADLSPDMLQLTRKRLEKFDAARYRVFEADCEDLDLADAQYDLVACIGVFGYIDEVDQALGEIRRVLKPGGTFVMSVRNNDHSTLFDVARLIRLPVRALKKLSTSLRRAPSGPTGGPAGAESARQPAKSFIDIWDRPSDVIEVVRKNGFRETEFYGVGYGPLQFSGKTLLPDSWAIGMSQATSRVMRWTRLEKYSKWVADVSVYVFVKA
jgi:2-polyprenyl-3-methyl-5-hydroxy-6-metoxy-1,4-benzoquinol methylase